MGGGRGGGRLPVGRRRAAHPRPVFHGAPRAGSRVALAGRLPCGVGLLGYPPPPAVRRAARPHGVAPALPASPRALAARRASSGRPCSPWPRASSASSYAPSWASPAAPRRLLASVSPSPAALSCTSPTSRQEEPLQI